MIEKAIFAEESLLKTITHFHMQDTNESRIVRQKTLCLSFLLGKSGPAWRSAKNNVYRSVKIIYNYILLNVVCANGHALAHRQRVDTRTG